MKSLYLTTLKMFSLGLVLLASIGMQAQFAAWTSVPERPSFDSEDDLMVKAQKADYYQVDFNSLKQQIISAQGGEILSIPMPNGEKMDFVLELNTTMHPGLAAKFPSIRTFNIISVESRNTWGKMDVTPRGFRAMIFEPGKSTVFVDPLLRNDTDTYIVYRRKDYVSDVPFKCGVSGNEIRDDHDHEMGGSRGQDYNQCVLHTYEIAVATTGECAQSMGGTVESALGEVTASVNRLNAILEKDFATTTTLVENNDEVIFLNGATDPYTNSDQIACMAENQETLDEIIGNANYDFGHVYRFSPGGGGIANLGSACATGFKARGTSGFNGGDPAGPFAVGIVAHEVGHQLTATHSFNNSCDGNRTDATAVEPGGGSTIMSYANVCPTGPEVQDFSDDYYHGVNMEQMGEDIDFGCAVSTSLNNMAPILEDLPEEIIIPASTPFILTAQAIDPDGDILTYCWEQMDNEITDQPPLAGAFEGPMFRTFLPTTSPSRYFPSLPDAQTTTWEVLPDGSRFMKFRVSVRDNAPGGGCTQYDDVEIFVDDAGGPFILEYPSASGIVWDAYTSETITWDVAGTNEEDFQGEIVDILLSTDGGDTYPFVLAEGVPNNGSYVLAEVPSLPTTQARVMVVNSAQTFFDVSNNNFTITGIDEGFAFEVDDNIPVCQGDAVTYNIETAAAFGFNENIQLTVTDAPAGVNVELGTTTLVPNQSTTMTVTNTGAAPIGTSTITLTGVAGEFETFIDIDLNINELVPEASSLISPANGATNVGAIETFSWSPSASGLVTYTLEIATDPNFEDLFVVFTNISETSFEVGFLPLETELFWRVGTNGCEFVYSGSGSFSTDACQYRVSQDVPVNIPSLAGTHESVLTTGQSGTIESIRVTNVRGLHSRIEDLTVSVISPEETEVVLFSGICGSDDDFHLSFADDENPTIDCPPTTDLFYAPEGSLSDFNGEDPAGEWTLRIVDSTNGSGGELSGWELEICYVGSIVSTTEYSSGSVTIFPNPSTGFVQISMSEPGLFNTMQVYDMNGKLLDLRDLRNDQPLIDLDLSSYADGIYLVSFIGEGKGEAVRLMKAK
jgi:subtilisin-like proprotein convertase family protein